MLHRTINPGAVCSVVAYFKSGKIISTRPLITKVPEYEGESLSAYLQIQLGDRREFEELCWPGISCWHRTVCIMSVSRVRSSAVLVCMWMCFPGELGGFIVTLGIMAVRGNEIGAGKRKESQGVGNI